ncbi:MAG: pyruvate kinase [Lentisphaeria bacterium]|nr:pyruvate kinase [Lentisphaeria bacterium]
MFKECTNERCTKIIATLGPATDSEEMLEKLIIAGVNVFRLNMSHAKHDWVEDTVTKIRSLDEKLDKRVAILMDTQGPAIRTGETSTPLQLEPGEIIALTVRGESSEEEKSVDVNYDDLVNDISVGDTVVVDNGNMLLKVLEKKTNQLRCEVLTEGKLGSKKHINLPGVRVNLPAMTEKDLADIKKGIEVGVDFIAMSFVREASDIEKLRGILNYEGAPQKIVAKLEDQQGLRNIDEIIDAADAIMIARGDLGIEVPFEELPIIQRKVAKKCIEEGKTVIVATHMLETMIENPSPTRAEITDVSNAVFEQADAIMLSGETTVGRFPVGCVEIMDRISKRVELSGGINFAHDVEPKEELAQLMKSACLMAESMPGTPLVVFTHHGKNARNASWFRPENTPIYAFTDNPSLLRQMCISRGLQPFFMDFADDPSMNGEMGVKILVDKGLINVGQRVIIVSDMVVNGTHLESIQIRRA